MSAVDPLSAQGACMAPPDRADGVSAHDRQRKKHTCYLCRLVLVAAVIEAGERLGNEVQACLKAHAPSAMSREDTSYLRGCVLQD